MAGQERIAEGRGRTSMLGNVSEGQTHVFSTLSTHNRARHERVHPRCRRHERTDTGLKILYSTAVHNTQ